MGTDLGLLRDTWGLSRDNFDFCLENFPFSHFHFSGGEAARRVECAKRRAHKVMTNIIKTL